MDELTTLGFILVANFAGYGLAWAAVTQWGYTGRRLDRLSWWFRYRWDELSNVVQTLILMVLCPLFFILFALFFILGIYGLSVGFGHAEKTQLSVTGEFYLGHTAEKRKEFDLHIAPRLSALIDSRLDLVIATREAQVLWLSDWRPDEREFQAMDDSEFYDWFIQCFSEQLSPNSDLTRYFKG